MSSLTDEPPSARAPFLNVRDVIATPFGSGLSNKSHNLRTTASTFGVGLYKALAISKCSFLMPNQLKDCSIYVSQCPTTQFSVTEFVKRLLIIVFFWETYNSYVNIFIHFFCFYRFRGAKVRKKIELTKLFCIFFFEIIFHLIIIYKRPQMLKSLNILHFYKNFFGRFIIISYLCSRFKKRSDYGK